MGIAVDRVDKAYAMSVPGGEVAQRVANVLERRPEVLASVGRDQDDARAVGESRPELVAGRPFHPPPRPGWRGDPNEGDHSGFPGPQNLYAREPPPQQGLTSPARRGESTNRAAPPP